MALLTTPMASMGAETGPGCGWGSMLMDGKNGLPSNVLAATTNGTFGNQTFGMTSGTAGCDSNQTIQKAAADFLNDNMEKVARDMSKGQGESLETLANLLGIQEQDKSTFFSVSQANFSTIFSSDSISSTQVMTSLHEVMKKNVSLSQYTS
ncbi:MAG: DUF3015 domain-containing protein [Candidatus Thiodiazotropha sp. (ex Lucinoma borealis)]|nr:DUF3015 domain-containing protein [Candidatus Thiodiazotropha sp. (ex Lucinoma borealis)]